MNGFGAGSARGVQHLVHIQIAFGGGHTTESNGFVGLLYMQRAGVGVGINGNGADAQRFCGTHYAHGNFATIGDQNLVKQVLSHGRLPVHKWGRVSAETHLILPGLRR